MAFKRIVRVSSGIDGGQGIMISELFVKFDVTKSDKEAMNSATVTIYNPNRQTELNFGAAGNRLVIEAGYADENVSPLFFGDVLFSETKRDGVNRVLTVTAQDGNKNYLTKKVTCSFKEASKTKMIVNSLVNNLALPVVGMENIPAESGYQIGYSFVGLVKDGLSEVLAHCGCGWSIQNETLYIIKAGAAVPDTGIFLTAQSGLISVDVMADKKNVPKAGETPKKITVKSILIPQLVPGARCRVQSLAKNIDGFFKIRSAHFVGDNRDGEFTSECEADAI
jgi:hypothetical protein